MVIDILKANCAKDTYIEFFEQFENTEYTVYRLRVLHSKDETIQKIVKHLDSIVAQKWEKQIILK